MYVAIPMSEIAAKVRSTCAFFTLNSVPSGGTIESSKTGPIRGSQYAAGSTVGVVNVVVVNVVVVVAAVVDVVVEVDVVDNDGMTNGLIGPIVIGLNVIGLTV